MYRESNFNDLRGLAYANLLEESPRAKQVRFVFTVKSTLTEESIQTTEAGLVRLLGVHCATRLKSEIQSLKEGVKHLLETERYDVTVLDLKVNVKVQRGSEKHLKQLEDQIQDLQKGQDALTVSFHKLAEILEKTLKSQGKLSESEAEIFKELSKVKK